MHVYTHPPVCAIWNKFHKKIIKLKHILEWLSENVS